MKNTRETIKDLKILLCEERLKRLVRTGTKKQQERAAIDLLHAQQGKFYMKNYKLIPKEAVTVMVEFRGRDNFLLYTTLGQFLVKPYEIKEELKWEIA